jgi:tRNA (cmo5U34)-methyltransferase
MTDTDDRTAAAAAWSFDDMGPEFDEHVAAHLPGYADVQHLIGLIATYRVPDGGTVADLGASTGLTIQHIADALPARRFTAWLYDRDESMLEQARRRLAALDLVDAHYVNADLDPTRTGSELHHGAADLTLAMWLLQFLNPAARRPLLIRARSRASQNGAILLACKTRMPDQRWQEIAEGALDDYKADHGVTADQRAAKTRSLRGVMSPDTEGAIIADLRAASWHSPTILWRWHIWSVIGAYAQPLT